jgi:hypothetical protein
MFLLVHGRMGSIIDLVNGAGLINAGVALMIRVVLAGGLAAEEV